MEKLLIRLNEINARLTALGAQDSLSDAETTEHAALIAEYGKVKGKIAAQEAADARAVEIDDMQRAAAASADRENRRRLAAGPAAPTVPATASQRITAPDTARITVREPDFRTDPNGGFKTHREFLAAVITAGQHGRMDQRLAHRQLTVGSDEGRGNSDPYGGFLVPEGFSPDFLMIEPEDDPMAARVTRIPMDLPIVKIPARTDKDHTTSVSGGLTVTRRPETVAGTASQMTLERVVLEAHELFGLSYATEELLSDSPRSFIALLERGFSDQFTYKLIDERLNGTGVGEFEGIMNNAALVSVAKEAGQSAKTLLLDNILKMRSRCWGYGDAIWLANHDCLPQLGLLNQQVGTAGTGMIWLPSVRDDAPDILLGRPLIFTEYTQTIGTKGDLVLGNWTEYLEGLYQPMNQMESVHVRFVNHERAFKFWLRNAGRSWWKSALTPKNSTQTLSPWVVIDTRA